jgi:hypothetical protein
LALPAFGTVAADAADAVGAVSFAFTNPVKTRAARKSALRVLLMRPSLRWYAVIGQVGGPLRPGAFRRTDARRIEQALIAALHLSVRYVTLSGWRA